MMVLDQCAGVQSPSTHTLPGRARETQPFHTHMVQGSGEFHRTLEREV